MKNIIEYKTVVASTSRIEEFDKEINVLINNGFCPYFGLIQISPGYVYQTMVKYGNDAETTMTPQQLNEWVDKNAEFQFTDETHETSKLCFLDAKKRIQESKDEDEQW